MANKKRIVVTGLGILSSLGKNREEFKNNLMACKSSIGSSDEYNKYFQDSFASEVKGDVEFPGLSEKQISELDRVQLWAYNVGREALMDSGLHESPLLKDTGVMIGLGAAGTEAFLPAILNDNSEFSEAKIKYSGNYSSISPAVVSLLNLGGGYEIVATACTASPNAIGLAFDAIQNGKSNTMLALGAEPLYMPTFAGFKVLDAMAPGVCSPFSDDPGMSVGEGAGALVLEEYEHALARGATIYAELLGYATSCDAYHETSPDPKGEGAVTVMNFALRNTGIAATEVEYLNAHGTGTEANDRAESLAIKKVFSEKADIPVSSTKAYFGHNIGSAGIIELIACLVTLPEKKILPTLNFGEVRSYVDLNVVQNEFLDGDVNIFMKNNYAFGGNNCSMLLSTRPGSVPLKEVEPKRVVISGLGSVSSLGLGKDKFFAGLGEGLSPSTEQTLGVLAGDKPEEFHWLNSYPAIQALLRKLPLDSEGSLTLRAHQVEKFNPRKHLRNFDARKTSAIGIYALVAFEQAIQDAGYKVSKANREELGLILGLSRGPQSSIDSLFSSISPDPSGVRTSQFPKSVYNSITSQCALVKGVKGYNTTLASGYGASLGALIQGYEVVRQSLQPFMVAGGADENAFGFSMIMHAQENYLNYGKEEEAFEVYGAKGAGYHMGEGAGTFFLEPLESAQERGADIYGEIVGYGRASESVYYADEDYPAGEAMSRAIGLALKEANIGPEDLDLICGSSWGTAAADRRELDGLKQALGTAVAGIPLTNLNAYFGFSEATSAGLNLMGALGCMKENRIYPIPFTKEFASGDFDFVTGEVREKEIAYALVLGASEGGNNYAVILKKV